MNKKEMHEAAQVIADGAERGQKDSRQAMRVASEQMDKLMSGIKSSEGKAEALKHHAYEIGLAVGIQEAIELHGIMRKDLAEKANENEASVLSDLWLAKVLIELNKPKEA